MSKKVWLISLLVLAITVAAGCSENKSNVSSSTNEEVRPGSVETTVSERSEQPEEGITVPEIILEP